mmetsp:Transcript_25337/g.60902  ORF Transcript_25337/g.60902 Transcript_25337/m.60902 type:complete len:341 (-) Transcript_25337:1086-2108(-)
MGGAGHVTRIVAPKAERYGLTPVNVSIDPHDSAGSVVGANVVRRNGAIGEVRCGGDGRAGGRASWGESACTSPDSIPSHPTMRRILGREHIAEPRVRPWLALEDATPIRRDGVARGVGFGCIVLLWASHLLPCGEDHPRGTGGGGDRPGTASQNSPRVAPQLAHPWLPSRLVALGIVRPGLALVDHSASGDRFQGRIGSAKALIKRRRAAGLVPLVVGRGQAWGGGGPFGRVGCGRKRSSARSECLPAQIPPFGIRIVHFAESRIGVRLALVHHPGQRDDGIRIIRRASIVVFRASHILPFLDRHGGRGRNCASTASKNLPRRIPFLPRARLVSRLATMR